MSFFRVPKEKTKRLHWLKALELKDGDVGCHHRVCSRHFPGGDVQPHDPQLSLDKRFASPKKRWTGRAKRAQRREALETWRLVRRVRHLIPSLQMQY